MIMTQTFLACPACMMTMRAIPIVMLSVTLIPTHTPCGRTHSQFPSSTWGGPLGDVSPHVFPLSPCALPLSPTLYLCLGFWHLLPGSHLCTSNHSKDPC